MNGYECNMNTQVAKSELAALGKKPADFISRYIMLLIDQLQMMHR